MAQRVVQSLVDDLHGGPADETVSFGLDGKSFEIDLDQKNANELRDVLEVYIENGRRVSGRQQRGKGLARKQTAGDGYNAETKREIRRWGREALGREVSDRGRLPGDLVEAWEQAHQGSAA